jgi:hypothetical protein
MIILQLGFEYFQNQPVKKSRIFLALEPPVKSQVINSLRKELILSLSTINYGLTVIFYA